MLRTLIPAISAASIQLSFFAIAFRITSCSFIIRSASRAGIVPLGVSTSPVSYPPGLDRTTHLLIRPDNSHTSDKLSRRNGGHPERRDSIHPILLWRLVCQSAKSAGRSQPLFFCFRSQR